MAKHPEAAQALALALVQAVKENPALVAQMAQQAALKMPAQMPKFGGWQKEGSKRGGEDDDEYYYYSDDARRRKEAVKAPRAKEDAGKAAALDAALADPQVTKQLNKAGLPEGVDPKQAVAWASENPEAMAAASETLEDPEVRDALSSGDPVRACGGGAVAFGVPWFCEFFFYVLL